MSPWPKDPALKLQGRYNQLAMLESLPAYTLRLFTHVLGWPRTESDSLLAEARKELMDPAIHMYST